MIGNRFAMVLCSLVAQQAASAAAGQASPFPIETIGRTTIFAHGHEWRVALTRQSSGVSGPAGEDETESHDLKLVLTTKGVRRATEITEAQAHEQGRVFGPYLSKMRLMGRDLLLLRLPSGEHTDKTLDVRLYDILPDGRVRKVFDAATNVERSVGACSHDDRVTLKAADSSGRLLVLTFDARVIQGGRKINGRPEVVCDELSAKQYVTRFEWKNGCYAVVPEDAVGRIDSQIQGRWWKECLPGKGLAESPPESPKPPAPDLRNRRPPD